MHEALIDRVEREDIALFLGACVACTGQREYYASRGDQAVSIAFLHDYVRGNYRRLYARSLAAGINDFSRAQVVFELLRAGAPAAAEDRAEEGALIEATLAELPPPRVYRLFESLQTARSNNRRTRATMRRYLARRGLAFDVLKYRDGVRAAARHTHLGLGEAGDFLFGVTRPTWSEPLLETWRRAHFSRQALFELPMTVAEGLAAKLGVSRKVFLEGIEGRMTAGERLRLERNAAEAGAELAAVDLARMGPTRLALYLLAMPVGERMAHRAAWDAAAERAARRVVLPGPVAAVFDRSRSASGSAEKRRRPLAVAMAVDGMLRAAAARAGVSYAAHWTTALDDTLAATARGQTDLGAPLVAALAAGPALVVIVSDGYENVGPGSAAEVARLARERLGSRAAIVHLNPVFDPETYMPRPLGGPIATVGIRDGEDLSMALTMARFVDGSASIRELEAHLAERAAALIARDARRTGSVASEASMASMALEASMAADEVA